MKETIVKISVNVRELPPTILDAEMPSTVIYIEADEYAQLMAAGLSEEENQIEVLRRSAEAYIHACYQNIKELMAIGKDAVTVVQELVSNYLQKKQDSE